MKGIVFNLLEDFLKERLGDERFEELIEGCSLKTREPFVGPGSYPDEDLLAWNHSAELMYGYREEESLQMNIRRLTPPDKETEHTEFVRRLTAGETVSSFETQRVAKDGHILDVWPTVTKVPDGTGKPIGIAATERDITERKRAEV